MDLKMLPKLLMNGIKLERVAPTHEQVAHQQDIPYKHTCNIHRNERKYPCVIVRVTTATSKLLKIRFVRNGTLELAIANFGVSTWWKSIQFEVHRDFNTQTGKLSS